MWRYVLAFVVVASSAAEAGQARSTFQVGLTITGPSASPLRTQTRASIASVPLPRARPAGFSSVTKSQGKPKLAADSE
jgi:hypothetical protein